MLSLFTKNGIIYCGTISSMMKKLIVLFTILQSFNTSAQNLEGEWSTCEYLRIENISSLILTKNQKCNKNVCSSINLKFRNDTLNSKCNLTITSKSCEVPQPPYTLSSSSSYNYTGELNALDNKYTLVLRDNKKTVYTFSVVIIADNKLLINRI